MAELRDALERARAYRTRRTEEGALVEAETAAEKAERAMQQWSDAVGQRIEEAMRAGQFDNLRNKGKPLKLERNPFVPADMEMANHLLENNDLPPSWISARTEMLDAIAKFRARFRGEIANLQQPPQSDISEVEKSKIQMQKSRTENALRDELCALNKRIELVNLAQPIAHLEIYKLVWEDECQRVF